MLKSISDESKDWYLFLLNSCFVQYQIQKLSNLSFKFLCTISTLQPLGTQQFPIILANPTFCYEQNNNIIHGTFGNFNSHALFHQQPISEHHPQPLRPIQVPLIKTERQEFLEINEKSQQKVEEKLPFVDKHNIVPNNINHILAFIQRRSKSIEIIDKIIERETKQGQNFNSFGFYAYQKTVKDRLSVHVNIKSLQQAISLLDKTTSIFSIEEQKFYNKIARIAVCYYLRAMAPLVTLNSQRLRNTTKQDHLKAQRYILRVLKNLDRIHGKKSESHHGQN